MNCGSLRFDGAQRERLVFFNASTLLFTLMGMVRFARFFFTADPC